MIARPLFRKLARLVVGALAFGIAASALAGATPSDRDDDASLVGLQAIAKTSGDLRLRVILGRGATYDGSPAWRDAMHKLVDDTRGTTDPLVLEIVLGQCRQAPAGYACDPVALARRWTAVDAENLAAWSALATTLAQAGDVASADEAWSRAGRASTFHDPRYLLERVVVGALPRAADDRGRLRDLVFAIGVAAAVPVWSFSDVTKGCRVATRRDTCAAIADTVFRDADTLTALMNARQLTAEAGQPADLHASRQAFEQAMTWALAQDDFHADTADDVEVHRTVVRLEDCLRRGEVAVGRDLLRERHVSASEGAALYVLRMNDLVQQMKPQ